jgi:putative DNA primase/helicase
MLQRTANAQSPHDWLDQFRDAIKAAGLNPPDTIEADGKLRRFSSNGKPHDDAGWYVAFGDGIPAGSFGDWRSGISQTWRADIGRPLTPSEEAAQRANAEAARRAREAEEARRRVEAENNAAQIWESSSPAPADHPYLAAKRIQPRGVRICRRSNLVLREMDCDGALVVPLKSTDGSIRSVEFIAASGNKRFLPGATYRGCYFGLPGKPGAEKLLCIAEGLATAASIHEATGYGVVAAMTAGNLEPVARALREKYPQARIIVCADDDHQTEGNPGRTKGGEAARAVGGVLTVPDFGADRPEGATDFNDLAIAKGPAAVKAAIEMAVPAALANAPAEDAHPRDSLDASAEADDWPKPQPLPDRLPPVMPFSLELLPDELRGWIGDVAERVQCPIEFPAVAAIVALGSVIGRKLAVRPKARDDWEEFPNLWGVIVGSPGVLKTPALMEALRPLRALEARALEKHEAELLTWQAGREAAKVRREAARTKARQAAGKGKEFDASGLVLSDGDEEPQPRRYIVNDSSIEALGMVLKASPGGVLAYRDELIGLLKSLDREGMEGARAFYLSAYSGKEAHVYDRIGRGLNIRVDHVCVSMLGSIQPSVIGRYLREAFDNGGDDGLLSRFSLLVWPDVSGEWRNVDRWPDSDSRHVANAVFERMENLEPQLLGAQFEENRVPFLRLSGEALGAFGEWREAFERKQRDSDEHPALVAHFAKYRKMVPTLALIFHLASRGTGPISEAALLRALAWAEVLESHARRAYASVSQARTEAARALLAKIRAGAVANPIRPRDVYLKGWSGLSDADDVRRAIELLEDLDYLRAEVVQTPGRSRTMYWINPRGRG